MLLSNEVVVTMTYNFKVCSLFQVAHHIHGWMAGKLQLNLLQEGYRMPKPQDVDDEL